ncbi:flagellar hook-associated family protein [Rhizobium halophytocola]|uniref:Flagellin n=1 Tax=Rhizobium halophytocola TaxID=735519 RepID=A0ABS4E5A9_9HYPH|nr:flagellar hook-associated family protein [Rhizobium halophytocola]MBP1853137.1 flagellar hook-associated protein 3 FlgL [Rhizobium halophytocola]
MKTSNVSNLSIQNSMRLTILQAQSELLKSQTEVSTGQYADVGSELGSRTSLSLDLTREGMRLQSLVDTNAIATQRLESSQEAMTSMSTSAQSMMDSLVALKGSNDQSNLDVAAQSATNAFDSFLSMANTSVSGEYLFAGINSDVQPLTDMDTFMGDFETAFQGYFGFPSTDEAQTGAITATQMDDFITNTVKPMFMDPGGAWDTDWSTATDDEMMSRISQSETVQTSTSANATGMRAFAFAAVLSKGLLGLTIQEDVRSVVSDKAIEATGVAISGIDNERTQLGLSQERVEAANSSLQIQHDIIETNFTSMVEVDAYEASTKVNNLLSLVEASYTLTAKIQQLSLVNYL